MRKNYKQLSAIIIALSLIPSEENGRRIENKLTYAKERLFRINEDVFNKHREDIEDLKTEYCFTNSDGVIQYNYLPDGNREMQYTKDGMKKLNEAIKKIQTREVTLEPFHCTDQELVERLPSDIKEILSGLLWPEPDKDVVEL